MSNEPKHTATPWEVFNNEEILTRSKDGKRFNAFIGHAFSASNAARIVQCVNACEGLSNEDLEVKVQIQLSNLAYKVDRNAQERDKAEFELESLRAENAELIEALRVASTRFGYLALYDNSERNGVIPSVGMNEIDTTLAKYEK